MKKGDGGGGAAGEEGEGSTAGLSTVMLQVRPRLEQAREPASRASQTV